MVSRRSAVAGLVLGLVLSLSSVAFTLDKPAKRERGERHPQIHGAMRALDVASRHLLQATHDYGGHRAQALELVRQAEAELRQALKYARAHPEIGRGATTSAAPKRR